MYGHEQGCFHGDPHYTGNLALGLDVEQASNISSAILQGSVWSGAVTAGVSNSHISYTKC